MKSRTTKSSKLKRSKSIKSLKKNKSRKSSKKVKRNESRRKITDGNENFKNELKQILESCEKDNNLFQYILNIFLVFANVRTGTLIEYNNVHNEKERQEAQKKVNGFIDFLNKNSHDKLLLVQCPTSLYYQIMIMKNDFEFYIEDENIGKILNFMCIGHDYANNEIDRLLINIKEIKTNCHIYAESCEFSKIDIEKINDVFTERIKEWNNAISEYNLPYKFEFYIKKDISQLTRLNNIDDKSFVEINRDDYKEDLYNYFHSYFLQDEDTDYSFSKYIEKYSLFKLIYILVIKHDIFGSLYEGKNLDEIEEVSLKLLDFDKELLKEYNPDENNVNLVMNTVRKYFHDDKEFITKFSEQLDDYENIYGGVI